MEDPDVATPDQLARNAHRRKATVIWSAAVDRRLDQLVERARTTEPDRSDLLAALVAAAPEDSRKLDKLVAAWRERKVREVVLNVADDAAAVQLPRHGPGRRARRPAR
jgi:hypothetical protein